MNIKDRMKRIPDVASADWNADTLTITIHYKQGADLKALKIRVLAALDEANLQQAVTKFDFVQDPSLFSMITEKGCVPKPFETVFLDAKTREEAESIFRKDHSESEAQIDEIQVNKFCAMVIYHNPKTPTV